MLLKPICAIEDVVNNSYIIYSIYLKKCRDDNLPSDGHEEQFLHWKRLMSTNPEK